MDPFKLLKTDHKKVSQLFKQIESASSGAKKAQVFSQLKSELDVHAHIEEKFLYPALEDKEKSREITLEAYEEHKVVKDLLAELASRSPDDEWDAKLTVLKENVEHHVEEEEGELFGKARDVLSKPQIERLGVEMEAEKAAQTNGGPPRKNASPGGSTSTKNAPTKNNPAQTSESPGVLQRLASFVGLGDTSDASARKTASNNATAKKAAAKKSTAVSRKAATKKAATKKAATKKTAPKKAASKGSATKTAAKRKQPAATKGRKTAASSSKKTAKKSASKKK